MIFKYLHLISFTIVNIVLIGHMSHYVLTVNSYQYIIGKKGKNQIHGTLIIEGEDNICDVSHH